MIPKEVIKEKDRLIEFVKGLGIDTNEIKNTDLLLVSMIHKSFAKDYTKPIDFNERLEFVGDAILGAVVSKLLYEKFPEYDEAKLTLYKIALVREETLAHVARDIKLNEQIFIGHGEEKTGGRDKDTILADAFEAFVGFLYIDLGEEVVYDFVKKVLFENYVKGINLEELKSPKSRLQEFVQKNYKIVPEYKDYEYEKDEKGNILVFKSEVYVKGEKWGEGYGSSKKKAQEAAAKMAIKEKIENI